MTKPKNEWVREAQEAARRVEAARQAGAQLTFLPDEQPDGDGEGKGVGRPKGARNKVNTQMREYLAARGCRLPEDVISEIAGLNSRDDAVTLAMAQTERVLIWAGDGRDRVEGRAPGTMAQRLDVFRQQYTMILRAAEALMPYMAPKASPDVSVDARQIVMVASAPTDQAAQARDVTPAAPLSARRNVPANVRREIERKQALSESEDQHSDAEIRTGEASD